MRVVWMLANSDDAPYFRWFATHAQKEQKLSISFIFLTAKPPKMVEYAQNMGLKCHWIKYDYNKRKRGMISSFFKVRRLLKLIQPDVVHTHLFDDSLIGLTAAFTLGIQKRIITKGDTSFHYFFAPKWQFFDRLNNTLATDIVAISEESKGFILHQEKADKSKVVRIHHGMPSDDFKAVSKQKVTSFKKEFNLKDKIVVGTIARFIEWKGYAHILKIAQLAKEKKLDMLFLWTGSGPEKKAFAEKIKANNLDEYIKITPRIERDQIPAFMQCYDVYLHAAQFEPFGLVIAEAMFSKLPIVSTQTGAAKDGIIPGENGYFFDAQNASDALEYILTSVENKQAFGAKSKQLAKEKFSIEHMYEQHINLYYC